ncbi:MKI67 FHA domain-interacting nucleolar phosphoprotein-like, partial [Pseudolycoriella hygida]
MGPVVKRLKKSIALKKGVASQHKKKSDKTKKSISPQKVVSKIKRVNKHAFDPIKANRGVVLLKNIPHGFYEDEMRKYFGQFGLVTRVRLARSQRTGRSKGFAYIEFSVPEVAKIAADTMNNYMMFKHVLKTVYIPPEKQTFNYFRKDVTFITNSEGERSFSSDKTESIQKEIERINRIPTDEEHAKRMKRTMKKLRKQEEKYGIDLSHTLVSGFANSSKEEPSSALEASETEEKSKKATKDSKTNKS